ncbi:MAG: class C sortase [Clostridia bacterium]|nr:class C sortase [Clostridia bacterium]
MNFFKKNISTILLFIIFFAGLSLLLYPSFADYWNSLHQSQMIADYAQVVAEIDEVDHTHIWQDALDYNAALPHKNNRYVMSDDERAEYESLLNISGSGVMGYIEIPDIKVSLPVYHGVDPAVLQIAVGHIEGSSLPVGGPSSHCVLSGHRGLPSAKLFTNLDQVELGDVFLMRILDETLTYEVDKIIIVDPDEVEVLEIAEGEDLCTLVTCTPYGVNSHRLLVRGHRVENRPGYKNIRVTADAMLLDPVVVAPLIAAPMIIAFVLWVMIRYRKKK